MIKLSKKIFNTPASSNESEVRRRMLEGGKCGLEFEKFQDGK
jgi:hypothetical protein